MELWKSVVGYEGKYEVSNTGRVRSVFREIRRSDGVVQKRAGKELKQRMKDDGYVDVKLSSSGVSKKVCVHILVARAFVPGYMPGLEVNHKDFNPLNNCANNLEWITHTDNINYTVKNGRHVTQTHDFKGTKNPNYNNNKLHKKYLNDKTLSKSKQSRPGARNGRAQSVMLIKPSGESVVFGYIGQCAGYIIGNGFSKSKRDGIAAYVSKAAKFKRPYLGLMFEYL